MGVVQCMSSSEFELYSSFLAGSEYVAGIVMWFAFQGGIFYKTDSSTFLLSTNSRLFETYKTNLDLEVMCSLVVPKCLLN